MHAWGACRKELKEAVQKVKDSRGLKDQEKTNDKRNRHSRGAPSAISIAVIPQDHRSLCERRKRPIRKPFTRIMRLRGYRKSGFERSTRWGILLGNHMLHLGSRHKR